MHLQIRYPRHTYVFPQHYFVNVLGTLSIVISSQSGAYVVLSSFVVPPVELDVVVARPRSRCCLATAVTRRPEAGALLLCHIPKQRRRKYARLER